MKKFTNNWFDNSKILFDVFLSKYKNEKDIKFLEIGSFEGKSTCYMLDNFLTNETNTITCIDSWEGGFEHSGTNFNEIYNTFISNVNEYLNKIKILN